MARKPAALARELLRNFPKGRRGNKRRRRKTGAGAAEGNGTASKGATAETTDDAPAPKPRRRNPRKRPDTNVVKDLDRGGDDEPGGRESAEEAA